MTSPRSGDVDEDDDDTDEKSGLASVIAIGAPRSRMRIKSSVAMILTISPPRDFSSPSSLADVERTAHARTILRYLNDVTNKLDTLAIPSRKSCDNNRTGQLHRLVLGHSLDARDRLVCKRCHRRPIVNSTVGVLLYIVRRWCYHL